MFVVNKINMVVLMLTVVSYIGMLVYASRSRINEKNLDGEEQKKYKQVYYLNKYWELLDGRYGEVEMNKKQGRYTNIHT